MKHLDRSVFAIFISVSMLFFSGCMDSEEDKDTTKMGIFTGRSIEVTAPDSLNPATARIVPGDSLVFIHSRYRSYGEEGDGFNLCFVVPREVDSVDYSPDGTALAVIGFTTGFAPNFADTLRDYSVKIAKSGTAYRIQGRLGTVDISGTYIPIP